jgi:hypothetical protein
MARAYFAAYHSYLKSIEPLDDAERGRLFAACLRYSMTGEEAALSGNERFVWRRSRRRSTGTTRAMRKRAAETAGTPSGGMRSHANACKRLRNLPKRRQNAKETENETKKANEKEQTEQAAAPGQGGGQACGLREAVERFKEHRACLKAPMTAHAEELMLARLETLSGGAEQTKIAILEQSIERGWKGVFALEEPGGPARDAGSRKFQQREQSDELVALLLADSTRRAKQGRTQWAGQKDTDASIVRRGTTVFGYLQPRGKRRAPDLPLPAGNGDRPRWRRSARTRNRNRRVRRVEG